MAFKDHYAKMSDEELLAVDPNLIGENGRQALLAEIAQRSHKIVNEPKIFRNKNLFKVSPELRAAHFWDLLIMRGFFIALAPFTLLTAFASHFFHMFALGPAMHGVWNLRFWPYIFITGFYLLTLKAGADLAHIHPVMWAGFILTACAAVAAWRVRRTMLAPEPIARPAPSFFDAPEQPPGINYAPLPSEKIPIAISLVALALFAVVVFSGPMEATLQRHDLDGGISISIPSNWKVSPYGEDPFPVTPGSTAHESLLSASSDHPSGGGIFISTSNKSTAVEFRRFIEAAKQPGGASALLTMFKSLFKKMSEENGAFFEGMNAIRVEKLAEREALMVSYGLFSYGETQTKDYTIYVADCDDYALIVTTVCPRSARNELPTQLDAMLKSIQANPTAAVGSP